MLRSTPNLTPQQIIEFPSNKSTSGSVCLVTNRAARVARRRTGKWGRGLQALGLESPSS